MTESIPGSELNTPILSHLELSEILQLLFCHGLHNNLHGLTTKIASAFPEIMSSKTSSTYRQLTIFSGFYSKFLSVGPLPYICHYKFLNTLHNGVIGMVRENSQLFHSMPISDLVKLVAGIRCLLCKAIIMDEKFVVKDVEDFIFRYFPTLPVLPENKQAWLSLAEILQFEVKPNNPTMKIINTINDPSARHLKEKLLCLSRERARSTSEIQASFLHIWKSIEDKLRTCMGKIAFCLNRNVLEILTQHHNFKLKLLAHGLSATPSEDELVSFVDHLQNVFIESQFWTSDLIRKPLIDAGAAK